ncbi:MAG TPA: prepilin-type N-terminal cleavage/methylation domain-containing protein [Actinomycetota bacterium]
MTDLGRWARQCRARLRGDAGVTLVELLVTVVILGVVFVAILGGMATGMVVSDLHRKQATAETIIRSYAEAVKAASYTVCAGTAAYAASAVGYSVPAGLRPTYAVSVTAVRYWQPGGSTGSFTGSLGSCPGADNNLQAVTLRAVSTDGRDAETMQVVKRKP